MRVLHLGFGFRPLRWGGLIAYAEDLMEAQADRGHEVGYFFAGRAYPFMSKPRLRRWQRRGVAMHEVVNTPIVVGGGFGTAYPAAELDHPVAEAVFARVLREFRPDIVHVQELLGSPTSLPGVATEHGIPVVMTAHDYGLLCPTLKLFDADGRHCTRLRPGEMCQVCSRNAPTEQQGLVTETMFLEETRFLEATRLKHVPRPRPVVQAVRRATGAAVGAWHARGGGRPSLPVAPDVPPAEEPPVNVHATPAEYDRRREVNVARLNALDLVLANSTRTAEIYRERGVRPDRLRTVQLSLRHLDRIPAQRLDSPPRPVRFITLAGCASNEKGTGVVLGALERLSAMGLGPDDFHLSVYGYIEERAKQPVAEHPAASWEGFYGPEHMDRLFAGQHVGIVPSIWEECYGFVGVEMLAAGLPVIGNAVGGITDYVLDGETGWLNRTVDGDGLAALMATVVADPQSVVDRHRTVLARRGELVRSFADHLDEMDAVYAELVAGRIPAAAAR